MRKFDLLCLDPIPEYNSEKIRALRDHLQLSQLALAAVLNTSLSTVRKWEVGDKHPGGPSLKLLDLLDREGLEAVLQARKLLHASCILAAGGSRRCKSSPWQGLWRSREFEQHAARQCSGVLLQEDTPAP
jgi:putative transcriptional regulator